MRHGAKRINTSYLPIWFFFFFPFLHTYISSFQSTPHSAVPRMSRAGRVVSGSAFYNRHRPRGQNAHVIPTGSLSLLLPCLLNPPVSSPAFISSTSLLIRLSCVSAITSLLVYSCLCVLIRFSVYLLLIYSPGC